MQDKIFPLNLVRRHIRTS